MGSKRSARPALRAASAPDPRARRRAPAAITPIKSGRKHPPARSKERVVVPMKSQPSPNAKPGGAPSDATASAAEELGGGNLDKVRDILFGGQLRDTDRRFGRLEERLSQETVELKEEVRKRLSVLEQFVKQEVESLADRIRTEHEERTDADKDASREMRDMGKAFEKKMGQLEDQIARVQRELRQQLLELHQNVTEEIRQRSDEILARLARESGELRVDKLDRTALATMLTEMAMRLNNELSLPALGGDGRA